MDLDFDNILDRSETGVDSFKFDAGEHNWLPSSITLDSKHPVSTWPGVFSTDYVNTGTIDQSQLSIINIDHHSGSVRRHGGGEDREEDAAPAHLHEDAGQVLHLGL